MPNGEVGGLAVENTLPPELRRFLQEGLWQDLAAWRGEWPEAKLAAPAVTEVLLDLPAEERVLLFRALPPEFAAAVFAKLRPATRDRLVLALNDRETRLLLADLQPDDRTSLLAELPGRVTQRL